MERTTFGIESKHFFFQSIRETLELKIVESSHGKKSTVCVGKPTLIWLRRVLGELQSNQTKTFFKSPKEGRKAFIAQVRRNRHGDFLQIVEFNSGGVNGVVVVPMGRNGRGWNLFSAKLENHLYERGKPVTKNFYVHGGTLNPTSYADAVVQGRRAAVEDQAQGKKGNSKAQDPISKISTVAEGIVQRRTRLLFLNHKSPGIRIP